MGLKSVIWNFQLPAAPFRRMDASKPVSAAVSLAWHSFPAEPEAVKVAIGALRSEEYKIEEALVGTAAKIFVFFETKESLKFFGLSWNVIDSKGPKMRKMGQMRTPWNVYENKQLSNSTLECY